MAKTEIERLKDIAIFSGLKESELGELARLTSEHSFKPGEFVFWEGEKPRWFYLVLEGRVKALKYSSSGKEFIIAFLGPGEMLGELAVLENQPYPASAQATTETRLLGLSRDDFTDFLTKHPEIPLRIITILGERLKTAQTRLRDLAGERAEARLARILLMLSSKLGSSLPFTRQEIADMAGLTIETAIRILSRLKKSGVIGSERGRILILSEAKLKLLSETAS
ncbi:MAG: Crp/Fnr family transcriptional regulator [Chloroflexota bacterium]